MMADCAAFGDSEMTLSDEELANINDPTLGPKNIELPPSHNPNLQDSDDEPLIVTIRKSNALLHGGVAVSDNPIVTSSTAGLDERAQVLQACRESRREASLADVRRQLHENRLHAVLDANRMVRVDVPGNGNCIFSAVAAQMDGFSEDELRMDVCNHLMAFERHYSQFVPDNSDFRRLVENLRGDGQWSSAAGDLIPLALANIFRFRVTIYSSREDLSVVRICSDFDSRQCHLYAADAPNEINLVYLAVPGSEHYDYCVRRPYRELFPFPTSTDTPATSQQDSESAVNLSLNEPRNSTSFVASYVSPMKKGNVRKRKKAVPEKWKKNIRKRSNWSGVEHVSSSNKVKKAKSVQGTCSCRLQCWRNIDAEQQAQINRSFWELGDDVRQKDFIAAATNESTTKRKSRSTENSRGREVSRKFFLTGEGTRYRVCKRFFRNTLNISNNKIDGVMKNMEHGHYKPSDGRGQHTPWNKTSNERLDTARRHIESFPVLESHYNRQSTTKLYLSSDLNISRMFELYKEYMETEHKDMAAVSEYVYRDIFCSEYNYSFHIPKKDACAQCNKYKMKENAGTLDAKAKKEYEEHQERKRHARQEKKIDKELAVADPKKISLSFDLESVLYTPCSLVSLMFYRRKLSCYNLSIYDSSRRGYCYVWPETEGGRGSCEIGTCLAHYCSKLPSTVNHVTTYSDTCGGQNRNKFIASALLHVVTTTHIDSIDEKFLESGHTHMECDSMHSSIEFAKKKTKIFVPDHWNTVITMARRKDPYIVVPLSHGNFNDYKALAEDKGWRNFKKAQNGETINWLKIKWIRVEKADPNAILVKYDLDRDSEFKRVVLRPENLRGRPTDTAELKRLHTAQLPVSEAKKRDLLSLCQSLVIPNQFHAYYKAIPSSSKVRDALPEPEFNDSDVED